VVVFSRVKAGSNTSTVTLRVVEGDEKGSLEYQTVKKYSHESHGTRLLILLTLLALLLTLLLLWDLEWPRHSSGG
jgi:hypothetical protein